MVGKNEKTGLKKVGSKYKMSSGVQVGTLLEVADNSGAKFAKIIAVKGSRNRLNRLPHASPGDVVIVSVKKGTPDMKKKVMPAVVVRQKKMWRRRDGVFIGFDNNACVILTPKGDLKGTAVSGPVSKEFADLWPKISSLSSAIV